MARRLLTFDWSTTPLGAIEDWPSSLRSAVALCMHSRFQMAIYWGAALTCIYNDAERDVLGKLHPSALGMSAPELLRDSWNVVGPQLEAVMARGEATWAENQPLAFDRRGVLEIGHFTYSYSPIPSDDGGIGGVLLVTQDTTARVLAERRLDVLRELSLRSMDAASPRKACELAAETMHGQADLEFTLIYLTDATGTRARCMATSGRTGYPQPRQPVVELHGSDPIASLFRRLSATQTKGELLEAHIVLARGSDSLARASRALATPIAGGSADPVAGFLVVGVNNDLVFDDSYRRFLEMMAIGVGRSVAASRAREIERARTRSIAEVDRAKTKLFGNASHELRTPLSLILGPLEQLLDDASLSAPAREQVALARRSAVRMLKLVNALLDFSRIEAGELIGAFRPTDLAQLTRDVAAMFKSTADSAGVRLSVDCPPLAEPAYVDRESWERIVSNLLSNALKFTPAGAIDIRTRQQWGQVVLTVQDTGIGIAPADLRKIFSRFYRGGDTRAHPYKGSGIGLALVRELVRVHGGSIEAESTRNQGTRMIVRIPLGREHLQGTVLSEDPPAVLVGESAALFVEEARGWLDSAQFQRDRESGEAPGAAGPLAQPLGGAGQRAGVLIVEDSDDMRNYLCRLLKPHYAVQLAFNGPQALEMAFRDPPSVVISDVMMPGMDGFGLLHKLREDTRTRDLPVMLVSARADPESTLHALDLGADDYLVKPFGARELLARIRATLQSSALRSGDAEARGMAAERALREGELQALLNDLRAAQRRVAAAGDAERRRIEGNLHDGAQQRLMAIRLELGLLRERWEEDPAAVGTEIDRLRLELDEALEELRELAHGLYPPLLASDGLCAAVSAAARRATIPVEMAVADFPRPPRAIESAAYFCCLEALQNATKHAGEGAKATVRLEVGGGVLEFRVGDDGVGFDRAVVSQGYGLTNLRDRVQALGGEAEITSSPGQGTTVVGQIPLP